MQPTRVLPAAVGLAALIETTSNDRASSVWLRMLLETNNISATVTKERIFSTMSTRYDFGIWTLNILSASFLRRHAIRLCTRFPATGLIWLSHPAESFSCGKNLEIGGSEGTPIAKSRGPSVIFSLWNEGRITIAGVADSVCEDDSGTLTDRAPIPMRSAGIAARRRTGRRFYGSQIATISSTGVMRQWTRTASAARANLPVRSLTG